MHIAEPLELPIPRGLAGPGMLADTIVKRWQDHMPLNRLEDMYARDGLELARSTICGWHGALAEVVKPLVAAMRDGVGRSPRSSSRTRPVRRRGPTTRPRPRTYSIVRAGRRSVRFTARQRTPMLPTSRAIFWT